MELLKEPWFIIVTLLCFYIGGLMIYNVVTNKKTILNFLYSALINHLNNK